MSYYFEQLEDWGPEALTFGRTASQVILDRYHAQYGFPQPSEIRIVDRPRQIVPDEAYCHLCACSTCEKSHENSCKKCYAVGCNEPFTDRHMCWVYRNFNR